MANLIDNIRKGGVKTPPTVAQIERQLEAQQAEVLKLDEAVRQAAIDAVAGDTAPYEKLKVELRAAQDRHKLLADALAGAQERDKADLAARQAAIRKTQIESRKRDAAALRKLAEEWQEHEARGNAIYQEMQDLAAKLVVPVAGISVPEGAINPGRIKQLVGGERFRISAPHAGQSLDRDHRRLLPGSHCPDVMLDDNWPAIVPFADQVRTEANAYIAHLKDNAV